jgi:hypothetical protein
MKKLLFIGAAAEGSHIPGYSMMLTFGRAAAAARIRAATMSMNALTLFTMYPFATDIVPAPRSIVAALGCAEGHGQNRARRPTVTRP